MGAFIKFNKIKLEINHNKNVCQIFAATIRLKKKSSNKIRIDVHFQYVNTEKALNLIVNFNYNYDSMNHEIGVLKNWKKILIVQFSLFFIDFFFSVVHLPFSSVIHLPFDILTIIQKAIRLY